MRRVTHFLLIAVLGVLVGGLVAACGASEEEFAEAPVREVVVDSISSSADAAAPAAPAQDPSSPIAAQSQVAAAPGSSIGSFDLTRVQASLVQQQRVIIRTVDMELVVSDVARSLDDVAAVARQFGGWVVSTNRTSTHDGTISVRVPAQSLDEAVLGVRRIGSEVVSELSSSQDVTDEYVDSQSRLTSLRFTEQALLRLFARTEDVEHALQVQDKLATLQSEIESILGRIRLMEETAAFSLIKVTVGLAPFTLVVDVGGNRTVSAGEPTRFQAQFSPPTGIEDFTFSWDFGDHSSPVSGTGYAPTTVPGQYVTATVSHAYASDLDSPYIVRVKITGTGDAGLAEGSATFQTTVKKIPTIEAFAGSGRTVEQGQAAEYTASFTRSVELSNFQYVWDFGDGTSPVVGSPEPGESRVTVTHVFDNFRPEEYEVTFTVTAGSDAGEVLGEARFGVRVEESEGLVIAGWSAGKNFKTAARALSAVLQAVATAVIWIVTFSPVWVGAGAIIFGMIWLRRRFGSGLQSLLSGPVPERSAETQAEQESIEVPDGTDDDSATSPRAERPFT